MLHLRLHAAFVHLHTRCTGKERDTESGLDYFGARYYGSSMGRFMSPDEPFANFDQKDPQSLNLYSYVENNPLGSVDADGRNVRYVLSPRTATDQLAKLVTRSATMHTKLRWLRSRLKMLVILRILGFNLQEEIIQTGSLPVMAKPAELPRGHQIHR